VKFAILFDDIIQGGLTMKRIILITGFCLIASMVLAMAGPAPDEKGMEQVGASVSQGSSDSRMLLIDDFESASLRSPREWWVFDIETLEPVSNSALKIGDEESVEAIGSYSLKLKGKATNWYSGGCGTYIAKEHLDASRYNAFQIDIYGNGPGSGTLKVELFDDDNNNWQAEQDPSNNYLPIYDDKYITDIMVDWSGWRRIVIPFEDFVDDNAGVGDDIWNPAQTNGSGGLLQLQFVCIAPKSDGEVNFNIDNVSLIEE